MCTPYVWKMMLKGSWKSDIIFSSKEKKKIVTLQKIIEQFEPGKIYPEKEVNQILKDIYDDFPTIRRYLIEYGFMERSKDCRDYWVK